ncbi:MAG TPA: hypothetical protein PKE30_19150, partial [Niabella sp.]|nr:hypothetical protein [Niabella sp.]
YWVHITEINGWVLPKFTIGLLFQIYWFNTSKSQRTNKNKLKETASFYGACIFFTLRLRSVIWIRLRGKFTFFLVTDINEAI